MKAKITWRRWLDDSNSIVLLRAAIPQGDHETVRLLHENQLGTHESPVLPSEDGQPWQMLFQTDSESPFPNGHSSTTGGSNGAAVLMFSPVSPDGFDPERLGVPLDDPIPTLPAAGVEAFAATSKGPETTEEAGVDWVEIFLTHAADKLLVVDGVKLYISLPNGLWTPLWASTGTSKLGLGAVQDTLRKIFGAEQNMRNVRECIDRLSIVLAWRDKRVRSCSRMEMNKHPLIETPHGVLFDLRSGETLEPETVRDCLALAGSLPVVAYNPDLLMEPPPGVEEALKHYGVGLMRRITWQLLGPHKTIDVVRMPVSNSGKTTLAAWVQNALGGGGILLDAYAQLKEREFSELRRNMATKQVVFLDEADKVDTPPSIARVNELSNETIQVNIKFQQEEQLPRTANVILIGADWPAISVGQGADTRFQWAWDAPKTGEMDPGLRAMLMTPEAASWLGTWLVDTAAEMYRARDDGSDEKTRAAAREMVDVAKDPVMAIMADIIGQADNHFLANGDLKAAFKAHELAKELPDVEKLTSAGNRWRTAVTQVVKGAKPHHDGKQRGWMGIALKVDLAPLSLDLGGGGE